MKKKIKVWIASDRTGTNIFTDKPTFNEEFGVWDLENVPIDCNIFKVDNSKHLYPEPKEVYFCIENLSKKSKKSKPWCIFREAPSLKGFTIEQSYATAKKTSSLKQLAKRYPKYHDFRLIDQTSYYYDFDTSNQGGWKHNFAVVATTNNKEQRTDIIGFVNNISLFTK